MAFSEKKGYSDFEEKIAKRFIEACESGTPPWRKPWTAVGVPTNMLTEKPYNGVNFLTLAMSEFSSNEWMTMKQIQKYNEANGTKAHVQKGSKGTPILKYVEVSADKKKGGKDEADETETEDEKKRLVPIISYVFNREQIVGLPEKEVSIPIDEQEAYERVERAAQALHLKTGLKLSEGGDRAYYSPSNDELRMPSLGDFESLRGYLSTKLHELGHSTMDEKRLDRPEARNNKFGSEAYAKEELVAEISSYMAGVKLGVKIEEQDFKQNAAYVKSWAKMFADKPKEILTAAKQASQVSEYLVSHERALAAEQQQAAEKTAEQAVSRAQQRAPLTPSAAVAQQPPRRAPAQAQLSL